jgi:hypothetical protein
MSFSVTACNGCALTCTYQDPVTGWWLCTGSCTGAGGAYLPPSAWTGCAPATGGGATPATAPAHLQFSATPIGTPIFLMYNYCRVPGQIIWAPGIDATNSVLDTSLLTFAACYGEPIDPTENIEIKTMSANGTLFYDINAGGVQVVANITASDMAQLQTCINKMEIYKGTETQLPSPTIEQYVGVGQTPAYRGLRYIVFTDFPLSISGNSVPNITIEWGPVADTQANVSDIMVKLIERVTWRTQYLQAKADNIVGTPVVTGIDDTCYGLTITSTGNLIDHFNNHRLVYNFQIKEGDPVIIARRAVGSSLVIDYQVNEADLIAEAGAPAMTTVRPDPIDFPVAMNLTFFDPFNGYDNKIAPAVFDGSQPGRNTSLSSTVLQAAIEYVVDSAAARTLAFTAMFNMRSFSAQARFAMDELTAEVGDTIAVTTSNGDVNVFLVSQQAISKNRSNLILGTQLLTQAGIGINGADSLNGGSNLRLYWPEDVMQWNMLADASTDRIWTAAGDVPQYFSWNNFNAPARRISAGKWWDSITADAAGANWGNQGSLSGPTAPVMLQDDLYIYWLHELYFIISRMPKTSTSFKDIETLVVPAGAANFLDPNYDSNYDNYNGNQGDNFVSCIKNGSLYIAWQGYWNGSAPGTVQKLVVFDLNAWSSTGWSAYTFDTGESLGEAVGIGVTDSGWVVIGTTNFVNASKYVYASLSDLNTWSHTSASFLLGYGTRSFCSHDDRVFFLEGSHTASDVKSRLAIVQMETGLTETLVDLHTKDPNYICHMSSNNTGGIIQSSIYCNDTHLFVHGNHIDYGSNQPKGDIDQKQYIGRFDLTTLNASGGRYLSELVYNDRDFVLKFANYAGGGKLAIQLSSSQQLRYSILTVDDTLDPATATLFWTVDAPFPINDDFANAQPIGINLPIGADLSYASTEAGEPIPGYASTGDNNFQDFALNNYHSVWYKFVAPATHSYDVSVWSRGVSTIPGHFGIAVYTGSSLGSLSYVTGHRGLSTSVDPSQCTISATGGVTYWIAVHQSPDGVFGESGGGITVRPSYLGRFLVEVTNHS